MSLTPNQLQTLKTDINADSNFDSLKTTPDGKAAIANAYNLAAAVPYWVWKSYLAKADAVNSTSQDGTTFNWAGNGFISRTVQELMTWENLWNASGSVNPSLANVRTAFGAIFTGGGNAAANIVHLQSMARRLTTRAEKLFASGTGSSATPGTMGAEGSLSASDIETALNLP